MSHHSHRITVVAIVLALGIALFPVDRAQAQCGTTDVVSTFCYIDMGPMTMRICHKQLKWSVYTATQPATRGCSPTLNQMSSNVTYCGYLFGQRRLLVSRPLGAPTGAYCEVSCDCGALRIDETDGLPVELMSFGVDGDADGPEEGEDREKEQR